MNNESGSILILTLWIIAIVSIFAMAIGYRAMLELRLSGFNIQSAQASALIQAGMIKTTSLLLKDANDYDTAYECGMTFDSRHNLESVFGKAANVFSTGHFAVKYGDEEKKLNINIDAIPYIDKEGEYRRILSLLSPSLSEELIDALIDWQDPDDEVTGAGGAENAFYQNERGYPCKNSGFESVEELLLVKGMTRDIYRDIADYITVYNNGSINLNTASQKAVNAYINTQEDKYGGLVAKLEAYSSGDDLVKGTIDDRPLTSLSDIPAELLASEESARLNSLEQYFVFKSDNYRIAVYAEAGRVKKNAVYVVRRDLDKGDIEVRYYHEL